MQGTKEQDFVKGKGFEGYIATPRRKKWKERKGQPTRRPTLRIKKDLKKKGGVQVTPSRFLLADRLLL